MALDAGYQVVLAVVNYSASIWSDIPMVSHPEPPSHVPDGDLKGDNEEFESPDAQFPMLIGSRLDVSPTLSFDIDEKIVRGLSRGNHSTGCVCAVFFINQHGFSGRWALREA
ncbi:hypothetical protein PM082_024040 [Marasmius tenuissimus]|nr:hypothetical protein PM082_024040 [Marasmius tenuissimus]